MAQGKLGRIQWGDLLFGPGSQYAVTAVSGVDDLPDIRTEDVARPGQHGDYTGPDWTEARTIQLKLGLRGESPDDLRDLSLALRNATQPQLQPAPLQFLDQGVLVWAKVRKRSIPYDAEYLWSIGDAALELYCADPYLYGLDEKSAWTTAYSPAAGRTYPLMYAGLAAATNEVLNPSTEVDTTNQLGYDPGSTGVITIARAASAAKVGTARTVVTVGAGTNIASGVQYTLSRNFLAGETITVQGWINLNVTPTLVQVLLRNSSTGAVRTVTVPTPLVGSWQQIYSTITLAAGESFNRFGFVVTTASGSTTWSTDAMMLETGAVAHQYVDGDQAGCVWNGTANASTSTRTTVGTNRTYGSAGTSGRLTAVNNGASNAFPVLRLDGPVANPAIEQATTGGLLNIDATLQAGEYLLIDTRSRAVLYMGSTPRRSWVRAGSVWPVLLPGSNEFAYRGSALPGAPGQTSLLTVTWRDTSL
ncbi:phage tail domain-containing protein [Streptomyces pseudovenezuelae]|uniref:phage distal tail protein n=1 Tax=Streptomyces pseudovenezuelae TaxID=67350 RepID=UPI0036E73286